MIIPAILEKTTLDFAHKIAKIQTLKGVTTVQVDFCDGKFVDNQTLEIQEFAEIGLLSKKFDWEAHLMIQEPKNLQHYKDAGFSKVIVHYEAFPTELLLEEAFEESVKLGLKFGIAINPETPVSVLRYFADNIHNFTLLSVHPGKQGNTFIPETFERIKELRLIAENATIEVDGGVNASNAGELYKSGADNLVVGSALFETENIKQNYQNIESSGTTV